MELNINEWKEFKIENLFEVSAGIYHNTNDYETGNTNYLSATNEHNGIKEKIDLPPDFQGNCITAGKIGCTAFYQKDDFCATSDVNILKPKFLLNEKIGLFLVTIINKSENYKWVYGRQCRIKNTKNIIIKLPIEYEIDKTLTDGTIVYKLNEYNDKVPKIDNMCKYSAEGYIPDFKFMEKYIETLYDKASSTNTNNIIISFKWK